MNDPLSLRALLAEPANGGLRIIAGPNDTELTNVSIEATEAELPADGEGTIAILTTSPPTTPWQQDALIRRTADRGFHALAMPHADDFGEGTRALAGHLALTLLHIEKPMLLAKACWHLLEAHDALTLSYVRKVARSIEHHVEALPDLLRHLSASVGYGIALIDSSAVLLEAGGHLHPSVHAAVDFIPWLDIARVPGMGSAASVRVDSPSRDGLRIAFFGDGLSAPQLRALAVAAEVAMPAVAARILIDEIAALNDTSAS
ncbi:MAG: PucR family transcriptional regulator, partial [Kineosporiaceae bacterium]|nr:PucR family transcriptional regulator [Aeromicrobium sp.]